VTRVLEVGVAAGREELFFGEQFVTMFVTARRKRFLATAGRYVCASPTSRIAR
jgi:hypothetical protein